MRRHIKAPVPLGSTATHSGAEPGAMTYRSPHVEPGRPLPEHSLCHAQGRSPGRVACKTLEDSAETADSHHRFCDLNTASSVGGMGEDDPDGEVAGLDAYVTRFDAFTDSAALTVLMLLWLSMLSSAPIIVS